ncbi:hypothetical protein GLAREA_02072 [Glarea lozoyensis ATCC 20868]|uniref:Uncharacterized protein n=1 Tax=Glarea lozoyensis (strain ATCC 20868 / MF5171) TaxID=1116229 RepID=S3CK71_GLAL2|nr:uncharacterized protein GLAREA_02072 [Glarea lozoyensis ATCC 20868]EPE26160.1 hypothetical protein GLAREA_02072 [Glarea lozoyensis ATCC 20868]
MAFAQSSPPTAEEIAELSDGLYSVTKFDDGTFSDIVLVANVTADTIANKRHVDTTALKTRSLPNPKIGCATNRQINLDESYAAYLMLADWCNSGNQAGGITVIFTKVQTAQWYFCNYASHAQSCSEGELSDTWDLVDLGCGDRIAGWVVIDDWAKSFGRDNNGVGECW